MPTKRKAPEAPSILIDVATLCREYNVSRTLVFELLRRGQLPQPIRTGSGRTSKRLFRRSEVERAIEAWPREAPPRRPAA